MAVEGRLGTGSERGGGVWLPCLLDPFRGKDVYALGGYCTAIEKQCCLKYYTDN